MSIDVNTHQRTVIQVNKHKHISIHVNKRQYISIHLNTCQHTQYVSVPVYQCQHVSIHHCSINHDSKKVKQNVSTNFNRTQRHPISAHNRCTSQNNISTLFIFSCKLFLVILQSRILPPPAPPPSFNSLNNRPICTKRCMDVMPQRSAVTLQKIKTCEVFRHCCHLCTCSEIVYDKNR